MRIVRARIRIEKFLIQGLMVAGKIAGNDIMPNPETG
jgi:hypothetical protein